MCQRVRRRRDRPLFKGRNDYLYLYYIHSRAHNSVRNEGGLIMWSSLCWKPRKTHFKYFLVSQKQAVYNRDFWPDNIWLSILFTHWLLRLHSKWNMAHFTGINEAPPHHQLRSRRRHGANKHGQFKRAENKSSTKGGPWSWATAVINSPVPPAPSTHPHRSPTVSISLQLCHANRIESANIKDLICYYHP